MRCIKCGCASNEVLCYDCNTLKVAEYNGFVIYEDKVYEGYFGIRKSNRYRTATYTKEKLYNLIDKIKVVKSADKVAESIDNVVDSPNNIIDEVWVNI